MFLYVLCIKEGDNFWQFKVSPFAEKLNSKLKVDKVLYLCITFHGKNFLVN